MAEHRMCTATSPTVSVEGRPPASYSCELPADHDGYHAIGQHLVWRDPEPILGEPKPWHPNHRPHTEEPAVAKPLDLDRIRTEWLAPCGSCDAGLPTRCVCPTGDPRTVIGALLGEIDRVAAAITDARQRGRQDAARAIVSAAHWAGSTLTAGRAVELASGDTANPGRFFPVPHRQSGHPHGCPSCSPDGRQAGTGCHNCRHTGMDQTPYPACKECHPEDTNA